MAKTEHELQFDALIQSLKNINLHELDQAEKERLKNLSDKYQACIHQMASQGTNRLGESEKRKSELS